ncbi:hypothetical protein QV13_12665 [Mesorhizobium hungaricum]|jgi:uncharacterized protein (UPF0335 family)|uniref:GapR-like DNA-binding domain-containing protein n=1 Tax=Mesorhizobium hungaricum TaxID=1566387 RepID=A0A1C2DS75_9HYPH|nr:MULTISPECIES: DUF2312 domain-containing protein [Mesorhizobium]MBN9236031.1 DUF2312 domain-containing protein [Mesorhizobium sp.]OCX17604.1 hypothetical protein QV13_12665 [Mesorhizobium hungaricum]
MSATVSDNLIRSLFERWERLEEEKRNISDDLKELFAEARGQGLDTKALRAVFREQVGDKDALQEFDAICDLYRASLNSPRAGRTREASSHGEDFVPLHRVSTQEPAASRGDKIAAPFSHSADPLPAEPEVEPQAPLATTSGEISDDGFDPSQLWLNKPGRAA